MAFDFSAVDLDREEDDQGKDLVQSNFSEAVKVNADQHAEQLQLSKDTGTPAFAVDETTKQKFNFDAVDFDNISKRSPKTTKFLSNFDNSVVAQDDVDVLQSLEDIFDFSKTFQNIGKTAGIGFDIQGKGLLLQGTDRAPDRIHDLIPFDMMPPGVMSPGEAQLMSEDMAKNLGVETDEQLVQLKEESTNKLITEIRALQEERGELSPKDLNLLEEGVRGGVDSLINMAPGFGLMLASGGRAAPLLTTMGIQTFGASYADGRAEGLEVNEATWFAGIDAAIEVGTEMLPTGTLEKILTGKSGGMKKAALKFMVQEMGTEQLATIGQSLNSYAFGLDEEMKQAIDAGDYTEAVMIQGRRQAVTAIATVVAGGAQATAVTSIRKGIESLTQDTQAKQSRGEAEQNKIDIINEKSTESKLRERDKESFKQFVEEADGDNNTNVFIDGAQASLYMQQFTPEEIAADPALSTLSEQVAEASSLGGDVQIPVAEFATEFAGTEHFDALRDTMTLSGETVAPFRQEQVKQEQEAYVAKLMELAQQNTSSYVEAQEIAEAVYTGLVDTGAYAPDKARAMADFVPMYFNAKAEREGITVAQAYESYGFTVEGPQTGERARQAGEMVLSQEPAYREAPILFESVRDEFLTALPEDATAEEVNDVISEFEPEYRNFIKALERDDWLGFDYPSQAISAVLSEEMDSYDVSLGLKQSMGKMVNKAFGVASVEQRATLLRQDEVTDNEISGQQNERGRQRAAERQAVIEETKSRTDEQALSEFNKAKTGETVTFNHRTAADFTQFDDTHLDVVDPERTPSAHLGHYLAAADVANVDKYGDIATVHEFKLENPLVISAEAFEDATNAPHEEMIAKRKAFMEMGHDGILVKGLNVAIVFEGKSLTKLEEDAGVLFEQAPVQVGEGLGSTEFVESITGAFANNPNALSADVYDASEYDNHSVFTFDDGKVGFAISPEGMLVSVFKSPDSNIKGVLDSIVPEAIARGATHLEAFEGFLTEAYSKYGFVEVDRLEWDDKLKPEGWTDEQGSPDLVMMELDNEKYNEYTATSVQKEIQDLRGVQRSVDSLQLSDEAREQSTTTGRESDGSLNGLPRGIEGFSPAVNPEIVKVAEGYMDSAGLEYNPPENYESVDPEFATRVADAYEQMEHNPNDPEVKAAYEQLAKEVSAQYHAALDAGLKVEFINYEKDGDPYEASPRMVTDDVNNNNHMWVFSTKDGFGSDETFDPSENPLLTETEFEISGQKALVNDLFRVVHDYYGHAKEGVGFRANGEENAFRAHSAMFSPQAQRALATETRGQNSWLNYGPHGEANRTAKTEGTVFADQKTGLLPTWASDVSDIVLQQPLEKQPDTNVNTPQFKQEARGYYDPANSIIRLTEAADLSTFLHEFAHFMYEMEVNGNTAMLQDINSWYKRNAEDVAEEANGYAPNTTILPRHVVAFLDEGTAGDKERDDGIRRAVHEQFARGFETYLLEGKAPSIELRNAFRTFARWLVNIYKSVKGKLNVNLDDQMRAVFDRLVATEDQIAAAEARAQVEPMFTDAAMAGMTEAEFIKYKERQAKVKDVQSETLRNKLIKQLTRQTEKWWKEEKSDIVDEQIDILKTERVYNAREQLKASELKLDHATVKEMAGETKTNKIGRTSVVIPPVLKGMTAKGQKGVHPDEAAAFLGYNSGSEMIADLIAAPSLKEQAEVNAEAAMVERHGDIFTDGTIEQQADEAVQNEERGKLILAELKALAKGTNVPTIDRATIKEVAITNIGKLAFREIHPAKYRRAEVRAAQDAARALAEGNKELAAEAKLRQVMNYYLGMEALNAKNETTKIVDRMARYNKKKVREEILKAENGYMDQIDKILGRFEFRKAATLKQVESLNLWVKERTETDGDGLVISNAVLNEAYVTHWKNVPFSDLQGVNDSVKNIEHVARYANKIRMQQEEIDFNKLKGQWVDHINEQDQRFDTKESRSRTDDARKATTMEHIRKWASQLTKVPYLASWLDGGERAGMSHDVLVQPFTDALDDKMKMIDEVALPVIESIHNRTKADKKRHMTKIWIPEIEDHLLGHQILAVALNVGNRGNLKKMLLGEGWADPEVDTDISIDNPKLQAVLSHMNKNDWELVQSIWDQMDILYPQLAEVHRRTTGLTPPKVEATSIINEHGEFRGGYYPVKYSPKRSHKAEKNAEKREAETESMFNNTASIQASVNAGATNERTGFYDRINLSLEVVPEHFNETIHYITHHDAVRQVNRLIQQPDVANAISGVLGEEEFKQLKPWLNDIAKDGRQQPVKTYIDAIFQRLRFGTTLGIMGFKASTGIMQVYGLLTTAAELGVGPTVKGIYTTIGRSWYMKSVRKVLGSTDSMQSGWEFASEKSKVMNHRVKTMDREIRNAMNLIQGKHGFMPAVQETSMKHIALIQTYMVDLPTWHAAYAKELSESGDESKAVNYADWAVENLQGSGATKDMATILRNQSKLLTTMTMFMTFFSSLGNLSRDLVKGKRSGLYSNTSTAAKLMFLFTLPVFFEMLMRGELDEPEDEDERMSKFLTQLALYPLTSIPFVRDAASGLIGDYGYNSSPVASVIEKGIQGYKQIGERALTDEEITKSAKKNASKLTGVALAVPGVSQAWATGEHLYDVMEEGEELTIRELLFGPKRE